MKNLNNKIVTFEDQHKKIKLCRPNQNLINIIYDQITIDHHILFDAPIPYIRAINERSMFELVNSDLFFKFPETEFKTLDKLASQELKMKITNELSALVHSNIYLNSMNDYFININQTSDNFVRLIVNETSASFNDYENKEKQFNVWMRLVENLFGILTIESNDVKVQQMINNIVKLIFSSNTSVDVHSITDLFSIMIIRINFCKLLLFILFYDECEKLTFAKETVFKNEFDHFCEQAAEVVLNKCQREDDNLIAFEYENKTAFNDMLSKLKLETLFEYCKNQNSYWKIDKIENHFKRNVEFVVSDNCINSVFGLFNKISKTFPDINAKTFVEMKLVSMKECESMFEGWRVVNGKVEVKINEQWKPIKGNDSIKSLIQSQFVKEEKSIKFTQIIKTLIYLRRSFNNYMKEFNKPQGISLQIKHVNFQKVEILKAESQIEKHEMYNDCFEDSIKLDEIDIEIDKNFIVSVVESMMSMTFLHDQIYEPINLISILIDQCGDLLKDNVKTMFRNIKEDCRSNALSLSNFKSFCKLLFNELNEWFINIIYLEHIKLNFRSDAMWFNMKGIDNIMQKIKHGDELSQTSVYDNIVSIMHNDGSRCWLYNVFNWKQMVYKLNSLGQLGTKMMTFANLSVEVEQKKKELSDQIKELNEFKSGHQVYKMDHIIMYKSESKKKSDWLQQLKREILVKKIELRQKINEHAMEHMIELQFKCNTDLPEHQIEMSEEDITKLNEIEIRSLSNYSIKGDKIMVNGEYQFDLSYFRAKVNQLKTYLIKRDLIDESFTYTCGKATPETKDWIDIYDGTDSKFNPNSYYLIVHSVAKDNQTYFMSLNKHEIDAKSMKNNLIKLSNKINFDKGFQDRMSLEINCCHPTELFETKTNFEILDVTGHKCALGFAKTFNKKPIRMIVPSNFPSVVIINTTFRTVYINCRGQMHKVEANLPGDYDKFANCTEVAIDTTHLSNKLKEFIRPFICTDETIEKLRELESRCNFYEKLIEETVESYKVSKYEKEHRKLLSEKESLERSGVNLNFIKVKAFIVKNDYCVMEYDEYASQLLKLQEMSIKQGNKRCNMNKLKYLIQQVSYSIKKEQHLKQIEQYLKGVIKIEQIEIKDEDFIFNISEIKDLIVKHEINAIKIFNLIKMSKDSSIPFIIIMNNSDEIRADSKSLNFWLLQFEPSLIEKLINNNAFHCPNMDELKLDHATFTSIGKSLFACKASDIIIMCRNVNTNSYFDGSQQVNFTEQSKVQSNIIKTYYESKCIKNSHSDRNEDELIEQMRFWSLCKSIGTKFNICFIETVNCSSCNVRASTISDTMMNAQGVVKFGECGIGLAKNPIKLILINPNDDYEIKLVDGEIKFPNQMIDYFGPIEMNGDQGYNFITGELHRIVSNIFKHADLVSKHKFNVEFVTNTCLARDILIDSSIIVEIKTQSQISRAKDSYCDAMKHMNEGLIVASKEGLYIDQRTFDHLNSYEMLQIISNFVKSYHKWRKEQRSVLGAFFASNLFSENINCPSSVNVNYFEQFKLQQTNKYTHGNTKIDVKFSKEIKTSISDMSFIESIDNSHEIIPQSDECQLVNSSQIGMDCVKLSINELDSKLDLTDDTLINEVELHDQNCDDKIKKFSIDDSSNIKAIESSEINKCSIEHNKFECKVKEVDIKLCRGSSLKIQCPIEIIDDIKSAFELNKEVIAKAIKNELNPKIPINKISKGKVKESETPLPKGEIMAKEFIENGYLIRLQGSKLKCVNKDQKLNEQSAFTICAIMSRLSGNNMLKLKSPQVRTNLMMLMNMIYPLEINVDEAYYEHSIITMIKKACFKNQKVINKQCDDFDPFGIDMDVQKVISMNLKECNMTNGLIDLISDLNVDEKIYVDTSFSLIGEEVKPDLLDIEPVKVEGNALNYEQFKVQFFDEY